MWAIKHCAFTFPFDAPMFMAYLQPPQFTVSRPSREILNFKKNTERCFPTIFLLLPLTAPWL